MDYRLNSIVEMKKKHACGANDWKVIRLGADIKIECRNCHRVLLLTREKFNKSLKKILDY
ncbi:DUF951 domain-containing protein [Oenococcus alcoholitolerans]